MFSALAEGHGDLKNKVNLFVALCPIVNLGWSTDAIFSEASLHYNWVAGTLKELNVQHVVNPYEMQFELDSALCKILPCQTFEKMSKKWLGEDGVGANFNRLERIAVDAARPSSDSSTKQLLHYAQSKRDKSFA
jgi:hypothetical protein